MEKIFKSPVHLNRLEKARAFLLSDKWMAILFCIAGAFTSLSSYYPDKQIEVIGTIVFLYIIGFCICIMMILWQVLHHFHSHHLLP